MSAQLSSDYRFVKRMAWTYFAVMLAVILALGLLHFFFDDLREGRVWWFNLDKERNLPTWVSGVLFFSIAVAALSAYYWENRRNATGTPYFRLPLLWTGIAFGTLFMSLDEMTILHENLFWREVRRTTAEFGDSWKYLTQWQLLFSPAIIVALGYFGLFFANRFRVSRGAVITAFAGIGCWVIALVLESIRQTLKQIDPLIYSIEVIAEEILEMTGALFLLATIVFYVIDIALDFSAQRRKRLESPSRFLTRQGTIAVCALFGVLALGAAAAYLSAQRLAANDAPIPRLARKALQPDSEQKDTPENASPQSESTIWFHHYHLLSKSAPIARSDHEKMVGYIAASMFSGRRDSVTLPARLAADRLPRIVFITVSDGSGSPEVVMGSGQGIIQAVERALEQVPGTIHSQKWLKVDFVTNVQPLRIVDPSKPFPLIKGVDGIAFSSAIGVALLGEEILANRLISSRKGLRKNRINAYLRTAPRFSSRQLKFEPKKEMTGYRFTTRSLFWEGNGVSELYRGHRMFKDISSDTLLSAAVSGGDYLKRAVDDNGRFDYAYLPKSDESRDKYNILRHAGTVYSMLELHETLNDAELLSAARRGINYLLGYIKDCTTHDKRTVSCLVEDGYVKLGGNALAVIALSKYTEVTGDPQYVDSIKSLGAWIESVQEASGEFTVHKQAYPSGKVMPFVSEYYPGEALLALSRAYRVDPEAHWLDTSEKGAQYLINVRDQGLSNQGLIHDHWLLYALNELYRSRKEDDYYDHAMRIAHAIVDSQNRRTTYPDWPGSYYRPPRSTPTATRTEGLVAAYRLARDFGDRKDAKAYLNSIRRGITFQLQTQFRPESVLYLSDPQRALGGFHRSLTDFEIRIDYVQHNISSLLGYYDIMTGS